jgi:putative ATPase
MPPVEWYRPANRGLEIKIAEKLAHLRELDRKAIQKTKKD